MPKGKRKRVYRRRSSPKRYRRRSDKRIPLLPTLAFIGNEMVALNPTIEYAKSGASMQDVAKSLAHEHLVHWTGMHVNLWGEGYSFDWTKPLYSIGSIVVAGFASKFAGKYVNKTLKKLPLVGPYVKM